MDECIVIDAGKLKRARVISETGQFAIIAYEGFVNITHLPTGLCVPGTRVLSDEYEPLLFAARMAALRDVPAFDLQSFELHSDDMRQRLMLRPARKAVAG